MFVMDNKMFVGNLPWSATEADLESLFSQAGQVQEVSVMRDKFTGRARGFAFVTMATEEAATAAIRMFEGQSFMGRPLKVNIARPLEDNPPPRRRFSGGNGGGNGGGGGGRFQRGGGGHRSGGYGRDSYDHDRGGHDRHHYHD